jgi:hypothetical protein
MGQFHMRWNKKGLPQKGRPYEIQHCAAQPVDTKLAGRNIETVRLPNQDTICGDPAIHVLFLQGIEPGTAVSQAADDLGFACIINVYGTATAPIVISLTTFGEPVKTILIDRPIGSTDYSDRRFRMTCPGSAVRSRCSECITRY